MHPLLCTLPASFLIETLLSGPQNPPSKRMVMTACWFISKDISKIKVCVCGGGRVAQGGRRRADNFMKPSMSQVSLGLPLSQLPRTPLLPPCANMKNQQVEQADGQRWGTRRSLSPTGVRLELVLSQHLSSWSQLRESKTCSNSAVISLQPARVWAI